MFPAIVATSFALVFANQAVSQAVSCSNDGVSACPYAEATTADLQTLFSDFCGDDGGQAYYMYYESLDGTLPTEGYYQVSSDAPGQFSQALCNSALNYIVSECDATGEFWVEGVYETEGVTFSVIPCELA